jgi:hypothetical protein
MSAVVTRQRFAAPAALAAVFVTALGWGVTVAAPDANAVTGRRVCIYAKDIATRTLVDLKNGGGSNPVAKGYVGVNYTKNRGCPKIVDHPNRLQISFQATFGSAPLANPYQVTCETFLSAIGATGKFNASGSEDYAMASGEVDVCKTMDKDYFYTFKVLTENDSNYVQKPGDFSAEKSSSKIQDRS